MAVTIMRNSVVIACDIQYYTANRIRRIATLEQLQRASWNTQTDMQTHTVSLLYPLCGYASRHKNCIPKTNIYPLILSLVSPTFFGMGGTYFQKFTVPALNKLIYLSVTADRGKTVDYYRLFFVEEKTPEPCTVNVEFYRTNGLMLAMCFRGYKTMSLGCHQAKRVILRDKRSMAIYQVHLRSQYVKS